MTKIEGWSLLEVDMDAKKKSFTVKRRLERTDITNPAVKPTFIFLTDHGAQLMINECGIFLIRFKWKGKPANIRGASSALREAVIANGVATPVLYTPPRPLKRLAKKAMKQLLASGKLTKE